MGSRKGERSPVVPTSVTKTPDPTRMSVKHIQMHSSSCVDTTFIQSFQKHMILSLHQCCEGEEAYVPYFMSQTGRPCVILRHEPQEQTRNKAMFSRKLKLHFIDYT